MLAACTDESINEILERITNSKDHYTTLGIAKEHLPSQDFIKAAFRRLCLILHPDKCKSTGEEAFKAVQEAYECLSDPTKRAQYDLALSNQKVHGSLPVSACGSFGSLFQERIPVGSNLWNIVTQAGISPSLRRSSGLTIEGEKSLEAIQDQDRVLILPPKRATSASSLSSISTSVSSFTTTTTTTTTTATLTTAMRKTLTTTEAASFIQQTFLEQGLLQMHSQKRQRRYRDNFDLLFMQPKRTRKESCDSPSKTFAPFNMATFYEVEKVVGKRVGEKGRVEYKLKWKGIDELYCSWLGEESLTSCREIINQFEANENLCK